MKLLCWKNLEEVDDVPLPPVFDLKVNIERREKRYRELFAQNKIPRWMEICFIPLSYGTVPCTRVKRGYYARLK
jgi:hypothetical protein